MAQLSALDETADYLRLTPGVGRIRLSHTTPDGRRRYLTRTGARPPGDPYVRHLTHRHARLPAMVQHCGVCASGEYTQSQRTGDGQNLRRVHEPVSR